MYRNKVLSAFVLFLLLFMSAVSVEAKIYLVSVGVADYPGTNADLRLPDDDAQTIKWLYEKNSQVESKLLLNKNATKENIISAMNTLFSKAQKDDIVVLFFSGHGLPGGFSTYNGTLTYKQVRNAFSKSKSQNKMIFADACYSGKMRKNTSSSSNDHQRSNVMLFLSSRSDEVSIERIDMKNGFFTTALQNGLRGHADKNGDRVITAKELFTYVSASVKKMSNDKQHPVMWGNFPNNMPVMVW